MAFPVGPQTGDLSCATGSTDLNHLFGNSTTTGSVRVQQWTFNPEADENEVTGFNSGTVTSRAYTSGLFAGTIDFQGIYPKSLTAASVATPRLGNSGLITFASAADAVTYAHECDLSFEFGEVEITAFTGAAVTARVFKPLGIVQWGGSWTTRHANSPTLPQPTAVNTGGAAATFKFTEDGAADPSITGSIIVPRGPAMTVDPRNGDIKATYQFRGDGDATSVAGSTIRAILPAGTIDASDWDSSGSDGTPDVTVVATAATSRTYTGAMFLRSLRIQWALGSLIQVSGTLRCAGAVAGA